MRNMVENAGNGSSSGEKFIDVTDGGQGLKALKKAGQ